MKLEPRGLAAAPLSKKSSHPQSIGRHPSKTVIRNPCCSGQGGTWAMAEYRDLSKRPPLLETEQRTNPGVSPTVLRCCFCHCSIRSVYVRVEISDSFGCHQTISRTPLRPKTSLASQSLRHYYCCISQLVGGGAHSFCTDSIILGVVAMLRRRQSELCIRPITCLAQARLRYRQIRAAAYTCT